MNEFIKKLIEQLNENAFDMSLENPDCKAVWIDRAISIVNQLAEEDSQCSKPSCKDCEVYDKEKHYCPKWCELIKRTTEELAEEYNNDCILVHTQGLDIGIQCAMCTNPMKSDSGCDGGCSVDKEMYKKVLDVIEKQTEREG